MQVRYHLAFMAALAALCLAPAARAQCPFHYDCESWVEYDSSENEVWASSYTARTDDWGDGTIGVQANLSTPADDYYDEDLDVGDPDDAEVDFGGNDGDGDYYIYGTHYVDNDIFYSSGSTTENLVLPSGETTTAAGWAGGYAYFSLALTGGGTSWQGDTVQEADPGGGGPDTCFDPQIDRLQGMLAFTAVSGSPWSIGEFNVYIPSDDQIGYGDTYIQYYRAHGRTPCGTQFTQLMQMQTNEGWQTYATNTITASIDNNAASSSRAGVVQGSN